MIKGLTTLPFEHFDHLLKHVSGVNEARQSLGSFLYRLKTGLPLNEGAVLFGTKRTTFGDRYKKIMIEGNGLFRKRSGFRTFDPDREKILDPAFTPTELYLTATESYLVEYINAYKAACREARLEQRVR